MELSSNGRFLIVGDRRMSRLQVLDRLVGFRPAIETWTTSQPTSLAFESSSSFLVGFDDGRFAEYLIDLGAKCLVHRWTNDTLRGTSPVTAIALDATARNLALAVGSDVLVFNRFTGTGETF